MRDFATKRTRVPESMPQGKKTGAKPKAKKPRISSGVWMLLGLFLGLLLAYAVVNHKEIQAKFQSHHHAKVLAKQPAAKPKPEPKKVVAKKPEFDFYHILPSEGSGVSAVKMPEPVANPAKTFVVQVASYPHQHQAESMRAKLLLLGFSPKIDLTGSGWYRVDIGPVKSMRAGDVLRHKLQNAGIKGAMIRQVSQADQSQSHAQNT